MPSPASILAGLAAALLLLAAPRLAGAAPLEVHIEGNETLLDPVLVEVLDLPARGPATPELAADAAEQLTAWLHETGYELSRVLAWEQGGALHILVDEGRLEKVVFMGSGSWKALRMRLDFHLPGDVYNSRQIQRELERLQHKYRFRELRLHLRVVRPPASKIIQITDLLREGGRVAAQRLWKRQAGRYELHIECISEEWGEGGEIGLNYDQPFGLELFGGYAGQGLFMARDRHRSRLAGALDVRDQLEEEGERVVVSHAEASLQWGPPPILVEWLRPAVRLEADLFNLQREDLGVDRYYQTVLDGALELGVEPLTGLHLGLSGGYQFKEFFDVQRADDAVAALPTSPRDLPYAELRIEAVVQPPPLRRDKLHTLQLRYRDMGLWEGASVERAGLWYQKVFDIGWEELHLRARGDLVWGERARWSDEVPLSSLTMRAVGGAARFARKSAQGSAEFRLSLHRDYFKISAFADVGVFGEVDRETDAERVRGLFATGPGAHFLILDLFQLDAWYGFGWRSDGDFNGQARLSFRKVF